MSVTRKQIGQKIRDLRKARGWTQENLAEKTGLHPTYIGGIERGDRNPTVDSLYKISESFGISIASLLTLKKHELEEIFNAPADDIMLAILKGFRAQVDVKGKLAELYLSKYLDFLKENKEIEDYEWHDKDGLPDFIILYKGIKYIIECKNLRSGEDGIFKKNPSYKVEVQKTRNSKDGTNTRSYPVGYFDILAVCMFNQTRKWDFAFISSHNLEKTEDGRFLKIFQPVPFKPISPWEIDLIRILESISKENN